MEEATLIVARGDDGRWFAEHPDFPDLVAFGRTKSEAVDTYIRIVGILQEKS